MKLLSFDVGIRNLSGCLLELHNDEVVVQWWGIVNLMDENTDNCGCKTVKGLPCAKPAKWVGGGHYYCNMHKSKHVATELLVTPQSTAGECGRCGKPAKFIVGALEERGVCTVHKNAAVAAHQRSTALSPIKKVRCQDQAVNVTKLNLWHRLDALPHLLSADMVIIEHQPSLKNPSMAAVAETLYSYWLCRGIVDKERTGSLITAVKYVSASNKLKIVPTAKSALQGLTGAAKYKRTKQLSVEHVNGLLKDDVDGLAFLSSHRKTDDLCEGLAQGIAFLVMNGDAVAVNRVQYVPSYTGGN